MQAGVEIHLFGIGRHLALRMLGFCDCVFTLRLWGNRQLIHSLHGSLDSATREITRRLDLLWPRSSLLFELDVPASLERGIESVWSWSIGAKASEYILLENCLMMTYMRTSHSRPFFASSVRVGLIPSGDLGPLESSTTPRQSGQLT